MEPKEIVRRIFINQNPEKYLTKDNYKDVIKACEQMLKESPDASNRAAWFYTGMGITQYCEEQGWKL